LVSCEDEVSEALYNYFEERTKLRVRHWHPPGGKKYLTPHLRIPIMTGGTRAGRKLIDLVLTDSELLLLVECKCSSAESAADVKKLRDIRDKVGLEKLKTYFTRQGVDVSQTEYLVLGLGVRSLDSVIPDEFVAFTAPISGRPQIHYGPKVTSLMKTFVGSFLP
jgi:hypothetical protein